MRIEIRIAANRKSCNRESLHTFSSLIQIKSVFTASLLDVQQLKGLSEAYTVAGRQVGRWQLDFKTLLSPGQGNFVNKRKLQLVTKEQNVCEPVNVNFEVASL